MIGGAGRKTCPSEVPIFWTEERMVPRINQGFRVSRGRADDNAKALPEAQEGLRAQKVPGK